MPTCSIDGCDDKVWCRGWCSKHYQRWRANGDPTRTLTPDERSAIARANNAKRPRGYRHSDETKAKIGRANTRHGMSFTPTHNTWSSMIQRCTDPNAVQWRHYGGRGITVCERWMTFENFYADMGERPAGRTLDRIDNERGYEPGNCRWATRSEQASNRRRPTR